VWTNWASAEPQGGFDAVIGNPPWERPKMQEVGWFAARAPQVARQARAPNRKRMIADMKAAGDPLIGVVRRAGFRNQKDSAPAPTWQPCGKTLRFQGRRRFFHDVHNSFKFSVFVVGGPQRSVTAAECAFFLRVPPEEEPDEQRFILSAADFALVNPNTGTAPIFRTRRDAALSTAIYRPLPVLVEHANGLEKKA
jgi:hypothetical protein